MNILICPHPDDEVLACFSKLQNSRVIFLFGDERRQIEATYLIKKFNSEVVFCNDLDDIFLQFIPDNDIYIPSPSDINVEHKWISNYFYNTLKLIRLKPKVYFYSYQRLLPRRQVNSIKVNIDLNAKIETLREIYPSQFPILKDCGIIDQLQPYEEFELI